MKKFTELRTFLANNNMRPRTHKALTIVCDKIDQILQSIDELGIEERLDEMEAQLSGIAVLEKTLMDKIEKLEADIKACKKEKKEVVAEEKPKRKNPVKARSVMGPGSKPTK